MKKILVIIIYSIVFTNLFAQVSETDFTQESYVSIKGSGINTIGHFSEAWESGSAFYISYGNVYASQWSLIFQTGYINFKENSEFGYTADSDPKFTIIPLQVGGRYYFLLDWIRPFLSAMNGINIITQEYSAEVTDEEGRPSILIVDETDWKYNFQVGFGLAVKVISNLELEGVFHYNSHILRADVPYNITGVEFGVGLNWKLN